MSEEVDAPQESERFADAGPATSASSEELVIQERIRAACEEHGQRLHGEMDKHEIKARETMMLDFLEIADNLERAAAWKEGGTKSLKSVQFGIDAVLRLFRSKLERYAVTAIEAEGEQFDPRIHHAVSQSTSTDTTPGTVLQEVQKGYRIDGRLLRPAAVVVASAPAKVAEPDASDGGEGLDAVEDAPQETIEKAAKDGSNDNADVDPADEWQGYQRNRR